MDIFSILVLCLGTFSGFTTARHVLSGVGQLGEPIFSFDPFSSRSSSSSASSASAASSSSTGSGVTRRVSPVIRRRRPTARLFDSPRMQRRRALVATIGGRTVLIVPTTGTNARPAPVPVSPRVREVFLSMRGVPASGAIRAQIGLGGAATAGQSSPPGVQFLGGGQMAVPRALPGRGVIYIDNTQLSATNPGLSSAPVAPRILSTTSGAQAANPNNMLPNTNLQITGLTPKGELIITGPGGSITIGTDLLNGISRRNSFPMATEFEEFEMEGVVPQNATQPGQPGRFELNQHGRGSIFLQPSPQAAPVQSAASSAASSASSASSSSASSASSSASSGAAASSAASSSVGGSAASASASAGGSSASSSSAASSSSSTGAGISLEQGGRVIRLGDNGGKTQVITLGGKGGQIAVENGGSGLQVPGNATFIVGG